MERPREAALRARVERQGQAEAQARAAAQIPGPRSLWRRDLRPGHQVLPVLGHLLRRENGRMHRRRVRVCVSASAPIARTQPPNRTPPDAVRMASSTALPTAAVTTRAAKIAARPTSRATNNPIAPRVFRVVTTVAVAITRRLKIAAAGRRNARPTVVARQHGVLHASRNLPGSQLHRLLPDDVRPCNRELRKPSLLRGPGLLLRRSRSTGLGVLRAAVSPKRSERQTRDRAHRSGAGS